MENADSPCDTIEEWMRGGIPASTNVILVLVYILVTLCLKNGATDLSVMSVC